MKLLALAGCALLLASTSACSTLGAAQTKINSDVASATTGLATAQTDQLTALSAGLGKLTDDLNERCNGNIGLTWNPPSPPVPSINVNCPIGTGNGAVSLKTLQSLSAAPAPAAPSK